MGNEIMQRTDEGKYVGPVGLTEQQAAFVRHLVAGGTAQGKAATLAGYGDGPRDAWRLLQNPRVLAAIRSETTRLIGGELAGSAVAYLRQVLAWDHMDADGGIDTKIGKLKLDAAKTILDRAGYVAPKAKDAPSDGPRDLEDYTIEELGALVRQGRETLDAMVDVTPTLAHEGEGEAGA